MQAKTRPGDWASKPRRPACRGRLLGPRLAADAGHGHNGPAWGRFSSLPASGPEPRGPVGSTAVSGRDRYPSPSLRTASAGRCTGGWLPPSLRLMPLGPPACAVAGAAARTWQRWRHVRRAGHPRQSGWPLPLSAPTHPAYRRSRLPSPTLSGHTDCVALLVAQLLPFAC